MTGTVLNSDDDDAYDLGNTNSAETLEPLQGEMAVTLVQHQKEWLAWALKQERSSIKGGILADEIQRCTTSTELLMHHRESKLAAIDDMMLPQKNIVLRRDVFDEHERKYYEALLARVRMIVYSGIDAGHFLSFPDIRKFILRLQMAVDHRYLAVYSKNNKPNSTVGNMECIVCRGSYDPKNLVVPCCGRSLCASCSQLFSATLENTFCLYCSEPVAVDLLAKAVTRHHDSGVPIMGSKHSSILRKINLEFFKTSTKIEALKEEIRNMIETDVSAKGIVFSQFNSFLDLIGYSLHNSGIKFAQLVGEMPMEKKEQAIKTFNDDTDCKIFLMSLKAGGVALNLTIASNVFMMEPWWNPAVELQAQDRIHRIGQYKPIRVVRFVIRDTIEEKILQLQERAIGDSLNAVPKLTTEDLKHLFDAPHRR